MSSFVPMPELSTTQQSNEDNFRDEDTEQELNGNNNTFEQQELSVETKTNSQIHHVNWVIDHKSLHIAKLSPKGDKRGVIEANITKMNHKFKLELCASGWRNSQDGYCAFYLTSKSTCSEDLFVARYRVQVGDITRISSIRHDFHLGVGFPNFCQQSSLDDLMSSSNVQFVVTIEVFSCSSQIQKSLKPMKLETIETPNDILSKLMNSMYSNRLYCDVNLLCQNNLRIPIHKPILAHCSPVFEAMFKHNLIENRSNEIHMYQWDNNTVLAMVKFLYTGKIDLNYTNNNNNKFYNINNNNGGLDSDEDLDSLSFGINNNISPSPTPILNTITNNNTNNDDDILDEDEDDEMNDLSSNSTNDNDTTNNEDEEDEEEDNDFDTIDDSDNIYSKTDNKDINMTDVKIDNKINNNNNNNNILSKYNDTFKLFQLGEYYKIESLIISCCQKMHNEININNSCDLLIKIQRYSHLDTIKCIIESIWKFIISNMQLVKNTKGYNKIVNNHSQLLSTLIDKITTKQSSW